MALLNPWMKFKKYFSRQTSFEANMKIIFIKNISNMSQGPPNQELRPVRVGNWDFLKKGLTRCRQFFSIWNLGSYEYLARLNSKKPESAYSLIWFIIVKIQCEWPRLIHSSHTLCIVMSPSWTGSSHSFFQKTSLF